MLLHIIVYKSKCIDRKATSSATNFLLPLCSSCGHDRLLCGVPATPAVGIYGHLIAIVNAKSNTTILTNSGIQFISEIICE